MKFSLGKYIRNIQNLLFAGVRSRSDGGGAS